MTLVNLWLHPWAPLKLAFMVLREKSRTWGLITMKFETIQPAMTNLSATWGQQKEVVNTILTYMYKCFKLIFFLNLHIQQMQSIIIILGEKGFHAHLPAACSWIRCFFSSFWLFAAFAKCNNLYICITLYITIPLEPYLCSLGKCKRHIHFLISPFYRHTLASSACTLLQNVLKAL